VSANWAARIEVFDGKHWRPFAHRTTGSTAAVAAGDAARAGLRAYRDTVGSRTVEMLRVTVTRLKPVKGEPE